MTKDKGWEGLADPSRRGNASAKVRPARADRSVERAIGSRLRAYYDEIAREPVPDKFVDLLKRLDEQDSGKK